MNICPVCGKFVFTTPSNIVYEHKGKMYHKVCLELSPHLFGGFYVIFTSDKWRVSAGALQLSCSRAGTNSRKHLNWCFLFDAVTLINLKPPIEGVFLNEDNFYRTLNPHLTLDQFSNNTNTAETDN